MRKSAIIIGASSGIGKAIAATLSKDGYYVGLTGRRLDLLHEAVSALPNSAVACGMDVSAPSKARDAFTALVEKMGYVDLVIIAAGVGLLNSGLDFEIEEKTIETNVLGFTAIACAAYQHFKDKGGGHLVGISSVAALRGNADAPAYNASKAYLSNYLEGLRLKARKDRVNVCVTDIRPGFVDTAMAQGDGLFWVATTEVAAAQIVDAIRKRRRRAYITRRWAMVAWLFQRLPDSLLQKL